MIQVRLWSEQWWVGVTLICMAIGAFAFIEGIWVYAQREVAFVDGRIVVRRWLEILLGYPGTDLPLDPQTRSIITIDGGRRLKIERDGVARVSMQLIYWETDVVVQLVNEFRSHGAALATPWDST